VRELIATGALPVREALRVLDVGAGLGATTWGVVRALAAAGAVATVEATWVDADAQALELGASLARARGREGGVTLRVTTRARALGPLDDLPRFDLVLAGQVLSELDVGAGDDERVRRHAALLQAWLDRRVEPDGSLVVVEPALRDRTRHLHRVRDVLAGAAPLATVFAPCLHVARCPALAREGDWCHEDLPVDLPAWLVPVARAAGLRHEGLTFSYLVLRKDGVRLVERLAASSGSERAGRLRVVSGAMPSKGKLEAFVCGELGTVAARVLAMRLDRHASPANGSWDRVARGDVITVTPAPELGSHRVVIGGATEVSLSGDTKSR
jgi:SAM-dependent methyltransferase